MYRKRAIICKIIYNNPNEALMTCLEISNNYID